MENKNITIKPLTLKVSSTPFALAKISEDLHKAAEAYIPQDHIPLVNYFLYLSSIEKGLKAAILSKKCTRSEKSYLKRCIGHDLNKVYKKFKQLLDLDILESKDQYVLSEVNKLYKEKGFEYFDSDMILQAMKGFEKLPELEKVKKVSEKINQFIIKNHYFIDK